MGEICVVFQQVGNVLSLKAMLNNTVTIGVIEVAVFFSMIPEMLSGPVALEQSIVVRYLKTSSSDMKNSAGQSMGGIVSRHESDRGGSMMLKLLLK